MQLTIEKQLETFCLHLAESERSQATMQKYRKEASEFLHFLKGRPPTKSLVLEYRARLQEQSRPQTVNAKLSAVHAYLIFCGRADCRVRLMKVQRRAFLEERRELSEAEYKRLLQAAQARAQERLYLVMLTLCSTGIRVSELRYITREAVRRGRTEITLKGKSRMALLPRALRSRLLGYAAKHGIQSGPIFRTRGGRKVYDGGGIMPDERIDPEYISRFAMTLYAMGYVDDFADLYFREHGMQRIDPRTFTLTDADYERFEQFMADKEVKYESDTRRALNRIKEAARADLYEESLAAEIEAIEAGIRDDKATNLQTYKREIMETLNGAVILRYSYAEGVTEHTLTEDREVHRAVALLDDGKEYARILHEQDTVRK